jgi:hypothetical protein
MFASARALPPYLGKQSFRLLFSGVANMARSNAPSTNGDDDRGSDHIGQHGGRGDHDNSGHGGNGDTHRIGVSLFQITGDKAFLAADTFYTTTFTTLSNSGVTGEAIIGYDEDSGRITVAISASGLEANQVHIQHIHGFVDGTQAQTPTTAFDTDGDGFVELGEGLPSYGDILLNLTTDHSNGSGGDNGHSHGDVTGFPTAPDGTIWFVESYDLPAGSLTSDPMLDLREIVIHGMSVPEGAGAGTSGEVDGTAGYKLVLPVASGELEQVDSFSRFTDFIKDNDFAEDAAAANPQQHIPHGDFFFG